MYHRTPCSRDSQSIPEHENLFKPPNVSVKRQEDAERYAAEAKAAGVTNPAAPAKRSRPAKTAAPARKAEESDEDAWDAQVLQLSVIAGLHAERTEKMRSKH